MNRDTTETVLWIFCIIVLLSLSTKFYIDSADYDCNECRVTLSNTMAISRNTYYHENISIIKLIESYKEGECLFVWDPTQGYTNNGYSE